MSSCSLLTRLGVICSSLNKNCISKRGKSEPFKPGILNCEKWYLRIPQFKSKFKRLIYTPPYQGISSIQNMVLLFTEISKIISTYKWVSYFKILGDYILKNTTHSVIHAVSFKIRVIFQDNLTFQLLEQSKPKKENGGKLTKLGKVLHFLWLKCDQQM